MCCVPSPSDPRSGRPGFIGRGRCHRADGRAADGGHYGFSWTAVRSLSRCGRKRDQRRVISLGWARTFLCAGQSCARSFGVLIFFFFFIVCLKYFICAITKVRRLLKSVLRHARGSVGTAISCTREATANEKINANGGEPQHLLGLHRQLLPQGPSRSGALCHSIG